MTKRTRQEFEQRRELNAAGWKVDQEDKVCFNGGSETDRHFVCKSQVAWLLSYNGYRVDSEVVNEDETAEADIVAYGNGEPPFVVEVETGITKETTDKKMQQFFYNEPFCEVFLLEVNHLPEDRSKQLEWIAKELPVNL